MSLNGWYCEVSEEACGCSSHKNETTESIGNFNGLYIQVKAVIYIVGSFRWQQSKADFCLTKKWKKYKEKLINY